MKPWEIINYMKKIMNKKIKLAILSILALIGLFTVINPVLARQPDVTCNSATIYGDIRPNNTQVSTWFEWGNDRTTVQNGNGTRTSTQYFNSDKEVSASLTGLNQTTSYYYRLVVQSGSYYIPASTETFATPSCPVVTPAPTVTMTANPDRVSYNGTSTITWYPNYATSCTASGGSDGWAGPRSATQSSFTATQLKTNTTFYMTCSGDGGTTRQQSVTVNVDNQVILTPTVTLTANPATIQSGQNSTLTWNSSNATSCSAYWTNSTATYGSGIVVPTSTTTYSITCTSSTGQTASSSALVTVNQVQNPTVTLTANPTSVQYGGSSTLSWSSQNATSCSANGDWSGSKTASTYTSTESTGALTLSKTYTYNITCNGASGTNPATATATVTVGSQPQTPTGTLTVSPSSCVIDSGQSTCTVSGASWNTSNATSPALVDRNTGATLSTSASRYVYLPLRVYIAYPQTVFDLKNGSTILDTKTATASCAYGTSWNGSTCVSNVVIQNPTVTLTATSPSVAYGSSTYVNWTVSNATSCSANGGTNGWSGVKSTSGGSFYTNSLYSDTLYTISCSNSVGSANASTTVTVGTQTLNPTGTLTVSPSSCVINSGQSTCTVAGATWNTSNATTPTLIDGNTNATLSTLPNNSSPLTVWVAYPQTIFNLKNGSTILDTKTATASCAYGTSWNGSTCVSSIVSAPTVSMYANPTSVTYGGSSTIYWSSTNTTSCVGNVGTNFNTNNATSGNYYTGALTYTTTYNIVCYGTNSSSVSASATVYVNNNNYNNQPPVINLYASPTYVTSGGSANINWNPTNSPTYCTASNGSNYWSGTRNTYSSNFATGPLYNTTVYTMTCGNSAGSTTESATVIVNNQTTSQTSVSLTADRTNLSYGESTILRWYPVNATSCYASGGSNNWAGTRNIYSDTFNTGSLSYTTTYTISCTNYNGGSDTKSVTIAVGGQQIINNQPTVNIYTDETSLPFNGTTFVRWSTTNATSCSASGGSIGWAGTKSIGPGSFYTGSLTTGKTYSISCSNSFGSANDSTTVAVRGQVYNNPNPTPAPTPTSLVLITSSVDRNQPIVPTIDNTRPKPGDEINYTVNYQNIGNGAITSLTLQMNLPQEVSYMFSTPNNPNMSGNNLIFSLGTLRANGQGTVSVRVKVRDNIPAGTNLNFPATLSYINPSGQLQSVSANVSAQVWSEPTTVKENVSLGALAFLGGNFLPNSLLGWLLFILLVILLFLAVKKAYYGSNTTTVSKKTVTSN